MACFFRKKVYIVALILFILHPFLYFASGDLANYKRCDDEVRGRVQMYAMEVLCHNTYVPVPTLASYYLPCWIKASTTEMVSATIAVCKNDIRDEERISQKKYNWKKKTSTL